MRFYVLKRKWTAVFMVSVLLLLLLSVFSYNYSHFRFVVMGDSRGATDGVNETTLRALLQKVKGLPTQPKFIIFTGDQVQGGHNLSAKLTNWKAIVGDYYPINRYYPSIGNHEADEAIFSNAFDYLPNEQLAGYKRTAYYFDYGNARFIVLNSDRKDANGKYVINSTQRTWLEGLLNNNGKTHSFVIFHMPAYPVGAHAGNSLDGNPAERDALWAIVDKYNVTAVLVGHEHNYNRRLVDTSFSTGDYTFENQIYQLTLGGAGAPLNSLAINTKGVVVGPKAVYHYMVVDIAGSLASFKVYDENNNELDSFTVDVSSTSTVK